MDRETIEIIHGVSDLMGEGVDTLLVKIEEIQRVYTHRPYAILERIPVIGGPARGIEQIQQGITHGVYGAMRVANWLVYAGASWTLDQIERRMD